MRINGWLMMSGGTGETGSAADMITTVLRGRTPSDRTLSGGPGPGLVANLGWSVMGEAVRLVSSFLAFLILLRIYEPVDFGLLVATTALVTTLFPLASLGGGWLALRRVTNDGWRAVDALAVTSGMTILGSLAVGAFALLLRPLILPQMPALLFVGVTVSDMLLLGLVEVTLFAAQATERLVAKAVAWSVYGLGRAVAAGILLVVADEPGLGVWVGVSIGVSLVVLAVAHYATVGSLVRPRSPRWIDVKDGLPYSFGFGVERLLATTDNILLVRFGYSVEAGLYAAARRLLTVSLAPCMAALHAVSARLWSAGSRSVSEARTLALRFTMYGVVYGLVSVGIWLTLGGRLAALLGSNYGGSAEILPWLSVLPLLAVLEVFAATALTGSGLHRHRVWLSVLAGLLNIALNLAFIPSSGWRGAVAASLISSAVYVLGLWLVLSFSAHRSSPQPDRLAPIRRF